MDNELLYITVEEEYSGMRLDAWLAVAVPELSRSYAQQLIEDGRVCFWPKEADRTDEGDKADIADKADKVAIADKGAEGDYSYGYSNNNGKPEKSKKRKVAAGETYSVDFPEPEALDIEAQDIAIDIVYEDDDVIVVNKPRGMVVHPGPGNYNGTLVNAVMYHCGDSLSSINGVVRPGIVHRIDKDTSGLLMIAKNNSAHESLAQQLKEHSCTRVYTALVYDNIKQDELTVNEPIGRDERNRMRRAVWGSNLKEAVTHIRVEQRYGKYTLITARLETGRTHQIRVHMAYIKHPLVGDELYGPNRQGPIAGGQMLHAGVLGFVHPRTGEYMEFKSELPEYFTFVLKKIEHLKQ